MKGVIKLNELCEVCHKRKATRLCDKVKGEWRFAGHPPMEWEQDPYDGEWYRKMSDIPMSGISTCDRKMCDECATNISGMDLCPRCIKEIREAIT